MNDFPTFDTSPLPHSSAETPVRKTRGPRRGTVRLDHDPEPIDPPKRKGRPPKVEAKSRASAVIPAFRLSDLEHLDPADIEPITQAWQVLASLDDGQRARVLALLGKALA